MLEENKKRLKSIPDEVMPLEVKEGYIKMKVGIMRRTIKNQAYN